MGDALCIHCDRPESHHHAFEAPAVPAGCVCDTRDWGDPRSIPAICPTYVRMSAEDAVCKTCEHEEPCHATASPTVAA